MRVALATVVVISGCSYKAGSFAYPTTTFAGQRTTVGCLDIAINRRADQFESAILDYSFGNRCDDPVVIDLLKVNVVGRTLSGDEIALAPYDPRFEITVEKLDAAVAGREALAYPYPDPSSGFTQVCVDAASLVPGQAPQWMCFASTAATMDKPTPKPEPHDRVEEHEEDTDMIEPVDENALKGEVVSL
jgi:hypothetical protein